MHDAGVRPVDAARVPRAQVREAQLAARIRDGDLPVVRLPRSQTEPDREALCVDNDVDLGREAAARSTETVICTPLFAVAAC